MIEKLTILFLVTFSQISLAQVAAIYDYSYTDKIIVLIGPENVDRFYPGQAASYIERYAFVMNSIENDIPRVKTTIKKLQDKSIRNKTALNGQEGKLEIYYLQLELLETFISLWENHETDYLKSLEIVTANIQESECYTVKTEEGSWGRAEIEIKKPKKRKSFSYYEFIDSSFLGIAHIYEDDDMEHQMLKRDPERLDGIYESLPNTVISECVITKRDHRIFLDFSFDEELKEFYNKMYTKSNSPSWQVLSEETGEELLLVAWENEDCN